MPDLHAFPRGHLLSDLSLDNQAAVAAYLTLSSPWDTGTVWPHL
jgi:hypothetical protein